MSANASQLRQAVIVDGVRTPFGSAHSEKGWFRQVRADELAANCLRELIARNNLDPQLVDDVIVGCALQSGEMSLNAARQIALLAGLPVTCPAVTVSRLCGSSLQGLLQAVQAIWSGQADVQLVAGVEKMTGQLPPPESVLHAHLAQFTSPTAMSMGLTAEFLASRYQISRADQDDFALRSHLQASAAKSAVGLSPEILPAWVQGESGDRMLATVDQGVRLDTSAAALARLKPVFVSQSGSITAGNSSQRSDGAVALLVMSAERARSLGYRPLASLCAIALAGVSPSLMGLGPVPAIERVLDRAGLMLDNIGSIELNEAFAAQALACIRQAKLNPERVNTRGGAIAIGHPLGASGARLVLSLIHSLHSTPTEFGLAALCIGMGQGMAVVLQRG